MSNTNTASVLDSVLSALVGSYSVTESVPVVKARKVSKPRTGTVRVVKAPSGNGMIAKKVSSNIAVPPVGSLDAASFLMALREAGKIRKANDAGIMITLTDSNKEKADQIQAIAGFVGYNFSGAHGAQLDTARQRASFTLRPVKVESKVTATVAGFVAGMPNGSRRAVLDLEGRIRVATDLMLDHEKAAEQHTVDSAEYATSMALATVESERIAHMKRDLGLILGA